MEKKKTKTTGILVFIIILLIIALCVAIYFGFIKKDEAVNKNAGNYKNNTANTDDENDLTTNTTTENIPSNVINDITSNVTDNELNTTTNTSANNTNTTQEKDIIVGSWRIKEALNGDKKVELQEIFGTSIRYGVGTLDLMDNKTFTDTLAPLYESEDSRAGTYTVDGDRIILQYKNGNTRYIVFDLSNDTLRYIMDDDYMLILENK